VQHSLEDAIKSGANATGTAFGFKTPTRLKNLFGMGGAKGLQTRNIIGSLVYVGAGREPPEWIGALLAARDRTKAAPTFAASGLYLAGADYDARFGLPPTRRAVAVPFA